MRWGEEGREREREEKREGMEGGRERLKKEG